MPGFVSWLDNSREPDMSNWPGLIYPLCGSWYANNPNNEMTCEYEVGDVCGNKSMAGRRSYKSFDPAKCSPGHPCPGILIPAPDQDESIG